MYIYISDIRYICGHSDFFESASVFKPWILPCSHVLDLCLWSILPGWRLVPGADLKVEGPTAMVVSQAKMVVSQANGEIQKQLGLVWEKWQEIMGFPANSLGFPVEVSLYHLYPILGMICPILSHPFWLTLRHFWICLNHVESKSHHLSIYVDDLGCASRNDSWLRNWNKHE